MSLSLLLSPKYKQTLKHCWTTLYDAISSVLLSCCFRYSGWLWMEFYFGIRFVNTSTVLATTTSTKCSGYVVTTSLFLVLVVLHFNNYVDIIGLYNSNKRTWLQREGIYNTHTHTHSSNNERVVWLLKVSWIWKMLCVSKRQPYITSELRWIFTARKRSFGQGNIFTPVCHSVHGGGGRGGIPACIAGDIPACLAAGGCAIPACLAVGGVLSQHALQQGEGGLLRMGLLQGGGAGGHPPGRLLLRAVRILLECILVSFIFVDIMNWNIYFWKN